MSHDTLSHRHAVRSDPSGTSVPNTPGQVSRDIDGTRKGFPPVGGKPGVPAVHPDEAQRSRMPDNDISAANLIAELERRLQPDAADLALQDDAALRTALLQGNREALRARLTELGTRYCLRPEHLQLRLTLTLAADIVKQHGLDTPDIDRAAAAGLEWLENLAFKCVELEAVSKADLWRRMNATPRTDAAAAGADDMEVLP